MTILDNFDNFGQIWKLLTFWTNFINSTIPVTCDIWDTDYKSDNWKYEIKTNQEWHWVLGTGSIHNTCDAFHMTRALILLLGCGFSKYMFQLCRDNVTKVALCTMQNPFYNQCSYFNKRLQQMMIWLLGRWEVNEDEIDKAILLLIIMIKETEKNEKPSPVQWWI